jgi:hypothetical protein
MFKDIKDDSRKKSYSPVSTQDAWVKAMQQKTQIHLP